MSKRERMLPKELEEMMNEARMLNNIIEVGERICDGNMGI